MAYAHLPHRRWRRDTGPVAAPASEIFVGRAGELRQLGRTLDAAHAGHGTTVLLAGEAGAGKTRLGSEVAARARGAGFEVLLGRSIDLIGTELPYQPFAEALRRIGGLPEARPWRRRSGLRRARPRSWPSSRAAARTARSRRPW